MKQLKALFFFWFFLLLLFLIVLFFFLFFWLEFLPSPKYTTVLHLHRGLYILFFMPTNKAELLVPEPVIDLAAA